MQTFTSNMTSLSEIADIARTKDINTKKSEKIRQTIYVLLLAYKEFSKEIGIELHVNIEFNLI